MSERNSWEFGAFAACLLLTAACANNADTGTEDQSQTPVTPSAGRTGSGTPSAGTTGSSAGAKATAGSSSTAGASGRSAGAGATVSAVAIIQPFMMAGATSGAAGAAGASAAGASGSSSTAGKGAAGSSSSSAGTGGKATAGAGGTGSGSGLTGVTGTATFSKAKIGVDLVIDISAGCEPGKSYPVHIHEGTSCESVATQMGHWGAPPAGTAAAGSGSAGAGAAGHDASHAAGGSGAAGSSAAAGAGAAGSGTAIIYRGEDIPNITCTGITGKTSTTRSTPDTRLVWSIGTMDMTDVVGHVLVVHDVDNSRIGCGKIELK